MNKLLSACLLLALFAVLKTQAFAATLNCTFKNSEVAIEGVESIQISENVLVVNESEVIQLDQTRIRCGQFGKQNRFDGIGKGLQVVLRSCTDEAVLEGHMIDSLNSKVADVVCDEVVSE